ncbi:MAG: hypothetical protein ACOYOP_11385 [Microthrixaceae bacterium]
MAWSIALFTVGILSLVAACALQLAGRTTVERAHSGNMAAIGTACLVFAAVFVVL